MPLWASADARTNSKYEREWSEKPTRCHPPSVSPSHALPAIRRPIGRQCAPAVAYVVSEDGRISSLAAEKRGQPPLCAEIVSLGFSVSEL
jgi:hypothetical protein